MVRNSAKFVFYKDLKKLCADLKQIYSVADEEAGLDTLEEMGRKWNDKYPPDNSSTLRFAGNLYN